MLRKGNAAAQALARVLCMEYTMVGRTLPYVSSLPGQQAEYADEHGVWADSRFGEKLLKGREGRSRARITCAEFSEQ